MQSYQGGCHCGKVRFDVQADLKQIISCNCSICSKKGHWLTFVPVEQFHLIAGEKDLSNYQFGKKKIHHLFCKNCGVSSFSKGEGQEGQEMRAINVRCLDGVDLESLQVMPFEGKNL